MADLTIHVVNDNGKTASRFSVPPGGQIKFVNDGAADMTIALKPNVNPGPVLCKGNNDNNPLTSFKVKAGKHDTVFVCKSFPGDSFAYSAQIEGTVLEDPIIIIQKDSYPGFVASNWLALAGGLLFGVVLTLLARRLFVKSRPT